MRRFFLFLTLAFYAQAASADGHGSKFHTDEITYVVTMSVNGKSQRRIDEFSEFYQALVEKNEPSTLAWQFYRGADEKIYLIERYENSVAALQHVINISPGGIAESEFGEFTDHFVIENILIHGAASQELTDSLLAIGLPLEFRDPISGYSRK